MEINSDATDSRASKIDREALPLIDMAPLQGDHPAGRAKVVAELRTACLRNGFFYLVNHGVPADLMREVVGQGSRFFAMSEADKYAILQSHSSGLGYGRMGGKALHGRPGAAVKEEFYYSRDQIPGEADYNRWPEDLPGFREVMVDYIEHMHNLAERVMSLLAEGMGLPADYFDSFCDEPLANVRLARYPPEGAEAGAHSDFGALTFLLQDIMGGLQVFDRVTGGWIHAEPIRGSYVVNLGDLFEVFTNKAYHSTKHRVIHPAGKERVSVPFFYTGRHDYVVDCLRPFRKPGEAPLLPATTPSGTLVAGHEAQGF